jgi:hypothetical protein
MNRKKKEEEEHIINDEKKWKKRGKKDIVSGSYLKAINNTTNKLYEIIKVKKYASQIVQKENKNVI